MSRFRRALVSAVLCFFAGSLVFAGGQAQADKLTIYSGRSESLVAPLVKKFEARTGIAVSVRYGGTSELAVLLAEEGGASPADIFWAQDGGALGSAAAGGLFAALPADIVADVPEQYRDRNLFWTATSGRARVLAYSPARTSAAEYPASILDLVQPQYRGRVGWAPQNASLQSQITSLRAAIGDEATKKWMRDMIANGTKSYNANSALIEAIAAGEIDYALVNNYYLLRYLDRDPNYPVAQRAFATGDQGNLLNVAGVGILKSSKNVDAARRFVAFLLSVESQNYFTNEVFEYPVVLSVKPNAHLSDFNDVLEVAPLVKFIDLADLDGTLALMRSAGAL